MSRPTYRTIPDYPAYSIDTHGHVWKDTEHGLTKIRLEIRSINIAKTVLDIPHVALEAQGQPTIWRPLLDLISQVYFDNAIVLPYSGNLMTAEFSDLHQHLFALGSNRGTILPKKQINDAIQGMSRQLLYLIWTELQYFQGLRNFSASKFVEEFSVGYPPGRIADVAVVMLTSAVRV
jgi:hypothetical protein